MLLQYNNETQGQFLNAVSPTLKSANIIGNFGFLKWFQFEFIENADLINKRELETLYFNQTYFPIVLFNKLAEQFGN